MLIVAIGIFDVDFTRLRAEVFRRTSTEITVQSEPKRLSPEEVKDHGIKLRAEFDKAFNALLDNEKAGHATEFTAIVLPYISAGMALEDAENVLKEAGFTEPQHSGVREEQDRNRGTDWYAVVAEIPKFSGRVFGNVEAYVMFLPPEERLAENAGRRHRMIYYPRP